MRNSKLQVNIFLFSLLVLFFTSFSLNLYFLKYTEEPQNLKDYLKTKFHSTEKEQYIRENPDVYNFFKDKKFNNNTEQIDFIRDWIFNNSIGTGDTNSLNAFQTNITIENLFLASKKEKEKPALSCGPRSLVMEQILIMMGYKCRFVSIFFTGYYSNQLGSHSFIEVYNPDTKHWEISDPLNNVYYIDSLGKRLNTIEISYMKKGEYSPCKNGKVCGIGTLTDDLTRFPESFKLISLKEYGEDFVILLNSKYYDAEKYYSIDNATVESFFKDKKYVFVF